MGLLRCDLDEWAQAHHRTLLSRHKAYFITTGHIWVWGGRKHQVLVVRTGFSKLDHIIADGGVAERIGETNDRVVGSGGLGIDAVEDFGRVSKA